MITTLRRQKEVPPVRICKVFADLYVVHCRYMVVYGGRRSGKSFGVSQLLNRRGCEHKRKIIVMRKYATTLRLSVWSRVKSAIEETGISLRECNINKSERSIELPTGSIFHFIGADDPQKLKSIEDPTDYWLEEANEFDEIDLDTIDAGLSTPCYPPPQIWFSFNPIPSVEGFVPWLVAKFINRVPHELSKITVDGDICVLRSWYKDNPFCPEATKKLLESYSETNPELYKMWALGEFTYLEGVIFKNWDVCDDVPEGVTLVGFGLDFGFSNDPLAVTKVWQSHEDFWFEEVIYEVELTNDQASALMEERGMKRHEDHIVADSAEPKSIKELNNLGWIVTRCDKGPDYKRAAIRYLKGFRLHVTRRSTNLIKEFSTWSWKKDKVSGRFLPIPMDGNDHGIDSIIYRTFTKAKMWGVAK